MASAKELKDKLFFAKKNGGLLLSEEQIAAADRFCEDYKAFLDGGKTERECVAETIRLAEAKGYVPYDASKKVVPGDKVYLNNRGKSLILCHIGSEPLENGIGIIASHVDSPRLDIKQVPLYENNELALLKTHYYGGIKKYQWTAIPLALHGVIVRKDMTKVTVAIGEDESDPVFCVTDLLPHLAGDQMKRSAPEIIKGEELNILIGSRPFRDDEASERVKLSIASLLFEKYGIVESDFLSAELEIVPTFKARDIGFDRSLIGAYGQDDRVCAYTSIRALLDMESIPAKTQLVLLADKEEIGSCGATGMKGAFMRYFVDDLGAPYGISGHRILSASKCLSADVGAAFDPTFPDVVESMNAAYINYGPVIMKFTGSRGKSGSNDASAEYMGEVRKMLDDNGIIWQTAELGKIDMGGGGTVAAFIAEQDVDTIDIGVPVLSMHAPYEVTSKIDVYETYRAFCAFAK
jgi:aspartyl aminopeptidase